MLRTLLAAAAAFALFAGTPALADGCKDCKNCPHAKTASADGKAEKHDANCPHAKMASADDKAEKKDTADKVPACPCGDGKECKCPEACKCVHCSAVKAKKADEKKI